jgi:hypothetical protein
MTVSQLVGLYEQGQITSHHLVVEVVLLATPHDVDDVLRFLPPKFIPDITDFTDQYRSGKMLTNYGRIPPPDNVQAVKAWLASHTDRNT